MGLSITLVLGGARSGKSRFAQRLADESGLDPVLIATAQAGDEEMRERIARHRAERPPKWRTIEEPLAIVEALEHETGRGRAVVLDCLTLWLSNVMLADLDEDVEIRRLVAWLPQASGPIVFVSNEVGLGVVPETPLGRRFRDAQGRLNQAVAAAVPLVAFLAAGLPLWLKGHDAQS